VINEPAKEKVMTYLILAPFLTLGLYVTYVAWRFARGRPGGIVDKSAGFLSYLFIMWFIVTRKEEVAKAIPFVSMDLSEMLGWRKDDGEVT